MKILHIIVGLDGGGAERNLKRLIDAHARDSRYQHSVVSLTTVGDIGNALRDSGVEVRALGMRSGAGIPAALWKLVRLIRAQHPDIVQTWMYHADLLGGVAAHIAGNPRVVWGIHTTDMMAGTSRATAVVRRACAALSRRVPRVIVCVAEASRRAHVGVGYDAERMVVIPGGFDVASLAPDIAQRMALRSSFGWSSSELVIGFVGRFNHYKDPGNFIRAAAQVAERFARARFLMVGRGIDPGNPEIVNLVAESGYPERFVLLGERSDVPACLSAMDVFCLPSRSEAFPNVVGEAMAMGLPSAVTDVGDVAMLVGDSGIVVKKEDSTALALALRDLLEMSPAARADMGRRARERVVSEFSMDRALARIEAVYAQVLTGKAFR